MGAAAAQALVDHEKAQLAKASATLKVVKGNGVAAAAAIAKNAMSKGKDLVPEAQAAVSPTEALQGCTESCSRAKGSDAHACSMQCVPTDHGCLSRCSYELDKCQCGCQDTSTWDCQGEDCKCWNLQDAKGGPIEAAMMKAENDALSAGLSP